MVSIKQLIQYIASTFVINLSDNSRKLDIYTFYHFLKPVKRSTSVYKQSYLNINKQ